MRYWWFGINNKKQKNNQSKSHVIFSEMEPFFKNREKWPYGGRPKKLYQQMTTGDKVILWMGAGSYQEEWGILGIAEIESISNNFYWISPVVVPEKPFKPYLRGKPEITKETEKLKDIFGLNFEALQKIYKNIGYIEKRNNVATTIGKVEKHQYDQVLLLLAREKIISNSDLHTGGQAYPDDLPVEEVERLSEGMKKNNCCKYIRKKPESENALY